MQPQLENARFPLLKSAARHACALATVLTLALFTVSGCGHKNVIGPDTAPTGSSSIGSPRDAAADQLCMRYMRGPAVHLEGRTASGAMWVIDKPAHWNGSLIAYMHGYIYPQLPLQLPDIDALRDSLLARGYALAASSYSSNGFAVAEGARETHELNYIFASRLCRPRHTYLLGQSLGGLIGMLLSQKYPEVYDGSLLVCGLVGSSNEEMQYLGEIRVLFDTVYPGVLGGDLEHPPVITDMNAQVAGPVVQAVTANPQGLGIIQMLARRPLPGATSQEVVTSLVNALAFAMVGAGDLLARTHGQSFFDNAQYQYTSPALPQPLLDDINARVARYTRGSEATAFFTRYGEPKGPFRIPVMALYTSRDPIVPEFHEAMLAKVAAGPMLLQDRIDAYGHCTFTAGELAMNFEQMVEWSQHRHHPVALRFAPQQPNRIRMAG